MESEFADIDIRNDALGIDLGLCAMNGQYQSARA